MERTLVITGKGKLSINPDLAIIRFPIESIDLNYGTAVDNLNCQVNLLRDTINLLGIDKKCLKTQDYRVDKDFNYNKKTEKREFIGFRVQHDLVLEVDFDQILINQLISNIAKLESNIEFKISFGVKDKESCLQLLIENAIENAKKKAAIIAKSADVKLKEIVNINYSFSDVFFHSDTDLSCESDCCAEASSMPDINPTDIDMSENVTITWRIE